MRVGSAKVPVKSPSAPTLGRKCRDRLGSKNDVYSEEAWRSSGGGCTSLERRLGVACRGSHGLTSWHAGHDVVDSLRKRCHGEEATARRVKTSGRPERR